MDKRKIDGLLKNLFVQDKKYRWEFEEDIFVLSTEIINFLLRKHWLINKHKMHRKDVNVYTVCKIYVKLKDIEFAKFVSPVRHDQQNLGRFC